MDSPLNRLENSINALAARVAELAREKNQAVEAAAAMREGFLREQHRQQAETAAMKQQYEAQVVRLEHDLRRIIDALRAENERYLVALRSTETMLQALLARLPENAQSEETADE